MKVNLYMLDELGRVVTTSDPDVWGMWFQGPNNRRVGSDTFGGVEVSTVFLGLGHSFDGWPPVLWETMVFGGELDGEMRRYTSSEDALIGHKEMCKLVQEGLK